MISGETVLIAVFCVSGIGLVLGIVGAVLKSRARAEEAAWREQGVLLLPAPARERVARPFYFPDPEEADHVLPLGLFPDGPPAAAMKVVEPRERVMTAAGSHKRAGRKLSRR